MLGSICISAEVEEGDDYLESRDLTQHPFYNTLHSKDCSIPEGTEVVHYPMRHPINKTVTHAVETILNSVGVEINIDELTTYSTFHFIKLLKQYSSSIIFEEFLLSQSQLNNINTVIEQSTGRSIGVQEASELRTNLQRADSFEDLNLKSKALLSRLTGGLAVFLTGITSNIYPVSTKSSVEEVMASFEDTFGTNFFNAQKEIQILSEDLASTAYQFNGEIDQTRKTILRDNAYQIYKKKYTLRRLSNNFVSPYREQLVLQIVEDTISQSKNEDKLIVINYGMFHDFSDDFEDYNFYTLPYACSMPSLYFSSIHFIAELIGLYMKNAHADVENKETILAILLPEIMDRVSRLSQEEQRKLDSVLKVFAQVGMGLNVQLKELNSETLKTYLLVQSAGSDEDKFSYEWDFIIRY